jgi:hypothetical protein
MTDLAADGSRQMGKFFPPEQIIHCQCQWQQRDEILRGCAFDHRKYEHSIFDF